MTTLISEYDVVDDGSKWRICGGIFELRDITWGISMGRGGVRTREGGINGSRRARPWTGWFGWGAKGRDASYDILPPEVPDSASGSVPAGYCPAAWSRSSCRSTWWSTTGSTRKRSASSAAMMARGPPTPAAGSGWDKVAAARPAVPPAPAGAARPRRRPRTASTGSRSSSSSSLSSPLGCRARPWSTRGTTSTAASSTAHPRRPPGASCPGCASSRRCSRDSSRWWRPYCSPDPAREPRRSCSCRARSLGWSSFSAWSWTRAAFDPAVVVVYRDAQYIIDRVNRKKDGRLATTCDRWGSSVGAIRGDHFTAAWSYDAKLQWSILHTEFYYTKEYPFASFRVYHYLIFHENKLNIKRYRRQINSVVAILLLALTTLIIAILWTPRATLKKG